MYIYSQFQIVAVYTQQQHVLGYITVLHQQRAWPVFSLSMYHTHAHGRHCFRGACQQSFKQNTLYEEPEINEQRLLLCALTTSHFAQSILPVLQNPLQSECHARWFRH